MGVSLSQADRTQALLHRCFSHPTYLLLGPSLEVKKPGKFFCKCIISLGVRDGTEVIPRCLLGQESEVLLLLSAVIGYRGTKGVV